MAGNDGVPQFDQRDAPYSRIVEGRIDMGSFESQIASVDFNDDHQLRCDDVDALAAAIVEGTNPPRFDLTADGIVDRADVDVWLTLAGLENRPSHEAYLTGDVDLNGKVDASDLDVVGHNWLQDVTGWCSADFNTDGRVDARDLNLLALNWHQDEFAKTNARAPRAPLANRMAAPNSGSPQGRFEFAVKSPPMFSPGDRSIESAAEYVTPSHLAKRYVPRELRSSSAYIDSSTHEADESQVQVEIVDFVLWRWNNRG